MSNFKECTPFKEMEDILISVKKENKLQSILSATDQENLDKMMIHFNCSSHFDYVYGIADKLAASKVERGRELIEVSKMNKADTVLIGDTLHDLEVGVDLGIDVILITHGHQSVNVLSKSHDNVLTVL
jgi:phosphoglycolate phosphatase